MNRFVTRMARRYAQRLAMKGVKLMIGKTGAYLSERRARKDDVAEFSPEREVDGETPRRALHRDERRGDDILYPVDEFTEDMQPRR